MFDLKLKAKRKLIDMQEIETPKLFFELPLKYLTQAIFYAMSGTPSKKPSCDLNFSVDSSLDVFLFFNLFSDSVLRIGKSVKVKTEKYFSRIVSLGKNQLHADPNTMKVYINE